ncbi:MULTISPECIES: hypothetical protein [Pectobacterium]|uniref:hypothetical protein n=1 Tax=Pectobacterium TaxID=122277 RepID=UPI002A7EB23F|nr:hypothetical protein [Pectobacterium aroidearum]MDY4386410.1 hypothetical protein [Pectobacterium aroidearum]
MIGSFKSRKPSAKIIRIETVDENGNPVVPTSYEYWVVVMSFPPVVINIFSSFGEALEYLYNLGYEYNY